MNSTNLTKHNEQYLPGGVVSGVRKVEPPINFARAQGAHMWDLEGNRYIDYHAAFAPHILGHNHPRVTDAVRRTIENQISLYGTGTNEAEGRLAELLCTHVDAVDKVDLCTSGTEASMAALRIARAATGKDHVIVMQGGFNGSHNDVACNVLTPIDVIGARVSPGEYPYVPLGAGVPELHRSLVHNINFNDLESVRYVCDKHPVAALITEPILQNIGLVKPQPGYLQGLRDLADDYGFLLIFDEVKTGFRYCVGAYSQMEGVRADLVYFAKAIASGYPLSAVGGRHDYMDLCVDPDAGKRVMVAGTYSGHPISVAAALATIDELLDNDSQAYETLDFLGQLAQEGLERELTQSGVPATVVRQGSAFSIYFMDHAPVDWHDLALNHDFDLDVALRLALIKRGIYFFPVATKQCSISLAHTEDDIEATITAFADALDEAVRKSG